MSFVKRYSVLIYFVLTFLISWGGFILIVGPGGFANTDVWQEASFGFVVASMLAGPSVTGLLMTGLVDGKEGLRMLFYHLFKWRVKIQWYAFALLPAPIVSVIALLLLSISSPIFSAVDKVTVLLSGIMAGLSVVFEEIGWTGFAIPKLRQRYSIFKTGLIVGCIWGLWHLLQQIYIGGTYAGEVPLVLYLSVAIFNTIAGLTAYRILLVWIYEHTQSLLVTTLMHSSLTACNIFIFRPEATGWTFIIFGLLLTALQWVVVAGLIIIDRKRFFNK